MQNTLIGSTTYIAFGPYCIKPWLYLYRFGWKDDIKKQWSDIETVFGGGRRGGEGEWTFVNQQLWDNMQHFLLCSNNIHNSNLNSSSRIPCLFLFLFFFIYNSNLASDVNEALNSIILLGMTSAHHTLFHVKYLKMLLTGRLKIKCQKIRRIRKSFIKLLQMVESLDSIQCFPQTMLLNLLKTFSLLSIV